jgi:hypothetical protein
MKFHVPEDVVQSATRCDHKKSCLATGLCGDHPLCEVVRTLEQKFSFLSTEKSVGCNCHINFGGSPLCMCPVRTYIFEHYNR